MSRRLVVAVLATLLQLVAPAVQAQAVTTASIYEVPETIDSSGATDVTEALISFFQSVPDNSVVRFPAAGRYRIEGTLVFKDRNNLKIEGEGSTFFATTTGNRTRSQWSFAGGSQIRLSDMSVQGANLQAGTADAAYVSSLEAQHAFTFSGVRGVELNSVSASEVYGDFVYLGAFVQRGLWTTDVWIHDSHFSGSGRQGISLTGARDVVIENNYIGATRRATFDLEPNGTAWGVDTVQIRNNRIGAGRLNFVSALGDGPVNNISIENNTLNGKAMVMSWKASSTMRHGLRIVGNVSDVGYGNNGYGLIGISGYEGIVVEGNSERLQAGRNMVGVDLWRSCDFLVQDNSFVNAVKEFRVNSTSCSPGENTTDVTSAIPPRNISNGSSQATRPTPTNGDTTTPSALPIAKAPTGGIKTTAPDSVGPVMTAPGVLIPVAPLQGRQLVTSAMSPPAGKLRIQDQGEGETEEQRAGGRAMTRLVLPAAGVQANASGMSSAPLLTQERASRWNVRARNEDRPPLVLATSALGLATLLSCFALARRRLL